MFDISSLSAKLKVFALIFTCSSYLMIVDGSPWSCSTTMSAKSHVFGFLRMVNKFYLLDFALISFRLIYEKGLMVYSRLVSLDPCLSSLMLNRVQGLHVQPRFFLALMQYCSEKKKVIKYCVHLPIRNAEKNPIQL